MANEQTTVLNIEVNYADGIKAIAEYKMQIDALKKTEQEYKKQLKEGTITQQEYNQRMADSKLKTAELNDASRTMEKQLRNQLKIQSEQEGSLKQMRAELSNLTAAYDSLSQAERESAAGTELKDKINEITTAIKGGEEETQRYYRNVGNYQNSATPLFEKLNAKLEEQTKRYEELVAAQGESSEAAKKQKKAMEETESQINATQQATDGLNSGIEDFISNSLGVNTSTINMAKGLSSVSSGAKMVITIVAALGSQLLKLAANPIVAILGLLAATIMAVSKGIKSSEENTNRWNVVLAPFTRLMDGAASMTQKFAGVILSVVEAGGKMLGWLSKAAERLPLVGKYFKSVNEENARYIEMAKEEARIAKDTRDLQLQNAKDALTIATLKAKADDELNVSAEERLAAIREANRLEEEASKKNYELAQRRYQLLVEQSKAADNTKETNDAIAQAEVEMYQALTEYQDKRGELLGREVSLQNEIKAAEEERAAAAKAAAEERTKAAEEAAAKEQAMRDKAKEEIRKAEDELLKLITDSRERQRQQVEVSYERQIEDLRTRLQTEKDLTVEAQSAINTQIVALEQQKQMELQTMKQEDLEAEIERRQEEFETLLEQEQEQIQVRFETLLEQNIGNEQARLEIELQQKKAELDALQKLESESQEAFNLRKLKAQNAYNAQKKKLNDYELQMEQTKLEAMSQITGSLSGLLEALGGENEAFVGLSKMLALAEIAINTGKAIAAGTAQAMSVPFPANLAAIATTIATVMANITTAINTVKSAKFATGGLVTGPGTGTSDSIPAMLSNGESVMTARTTSMFAPILSSFNQMGGGVPISVAESSNQTLGEDMLARSIQKGMAGIRPVVSVEEITQVSNRVKVVEAVGTL
ncbi:hypothetical protein H6A66_13250 [Bacteroides caecigallinarum]|uniref:hypothetical protein n=1 Tax=Bacteroides caecigallinarum TaxID=1411144 RepID=UPI00195B0BC2|nr:hypothetical protein [Bacteroides caecigallinarum]MBM6866128.1 hypothetical protein [Bacteroides caecigallinarum]